MKNDKVLIFSFFHEQLVKLLFSKAILNLNLHFKWGKKKYDPFVALHELKV